MGSRRENKGRISITNQVAEGLDRGRRGPEGEKGKKGTTNNQEAKDAGGGTLI